MTALIRMSARLRIYIRKGTNSIQRSDTRTYYCAASGKKIRGVICHCRNRIAVPQRNKKRQEAKQTFFAFYFFNPRLGRYAEKLITRGGCKQTGALQFHAPGPRDKKTEDDQRHKSRTREHFIVQSSAYICPRHTSHTHQRTKTKVK